jgi:uncharacterized membrane-anchored protein YhcB (DUF1043 family)
LLGLGKISGCEVVAVAVRSNRIGDLSTTRSSTMSGQTVLWIVIAVVVLAVIAAVVVAMSRRRTSAHRSEAQDLRERAQSQRVTVQRHEAEAAEVDARARQAQAEADAKAATAAQLQADAQLRAEHAGSTRQEMHDQLERADEIDPDMTTDRAADDEDRSGRDGRADDVDLRAQEGQHRTMDRDR